MVTLGEVVTGRDHEGTFVKVPIFCFFIWVVVACMPLLYENSSNGPPVIFELLFVFYTLIEFMHTYKHICTHRNQLLK